jgi:hypothetical protein
MLEESTVTRCPECGALQPDGRKCEQDFHQCLFWEQEFPETGAVHHLLVLCYHVQHAGLYSREGLAEGKQLLVEFVERGAAPAEVRRRSRQRLDSGNRNWKIKAGADSRGSYEHPVAWSVTLADVVRGGPQAYCENVRAWARASLDALKRSGNL